MNSNPELLSKDLFFSFLTIHRDVCDLVVLVRIDTGFYHDEYELSRLTSHHTENEKNKCKSSKIVSCETNSRKCSSAFCLRFSRSIFSPPIYFHLKIGTPPFAHIDSRLHKKLYFVSQMIHSLQARRLHNSKHILLTTQITVELS